MSRSSGHSQGHRRNKSVCVYSVGGWSERRSRLLTNCCLLLLFVVDTSVHDVRQRWWWWWWCVLMTVSARVTLPHVLEPTFTCGQWTVVRSLTLTLRSVAVSRSSVLPCLRYEFTSCLSAHCLLYCTSLYIMYTLWTEKKRTKLFFLI